MQFFSTSGACHVTLDRNPVTSPTWWKDKHQVRTWDLSMTNGTYPWSCGTNGTYPWWYDTNGPYLWSSGTNGDGYARKLVLKFMNTWCFQFPIEKEFEDTKGLIRIRKSKKDRQHSGKRKREKIKQRSTKHTYITKDRATRSPLKTGC